MLIFQFQIDMNQIFQMRYYEALQNKEVQSSMKDFCPNCTIDFTPKGEKPYRGGEKEYGVA